MIVSTESTESIESIKSTERIHDRVRGDEHDVADGVHGSVLKRRRQFQVHRVRESMSRFENGKNEQEEGNRRRLGNARRQRQQHEGRR